MKQTIWNRPLTWNELEEHFPGAGIGWDILVQSMKEPPSDLRIMAVWTLDHVPCPSGRREGCQLCQLGTNELILTVTLKHTKFTWRPQLERWEMTGRNTY